MSDKVYITNGILGVQSGTVDNIVICKNGVIRIKRELKKKVSK